MPEMLAAWTGAFSLGLLIAGSFMVAGIRATVARTERKLDALLRHSGVDMANLAGQEVEALMKAGEKIKAIKAYRDLTGAGLAEAKAAVERMES